MSEPLKTTIAPVVRKSAAQPVDPALFLSGHKIDVRIDSAATCPDGTPVPIFRSCFNAPILEFEPIFWLVFSAPKLPEFRAKQPITAAFTGGRSGHFGTHLGATGGTQTHSRRTGGKLEQLPCARQGLVRVPESNTKYGGKGRKTGGHPTPSVEPSISESSGIPKRKK